MTEFNDVIPPVTEGEEQVLTQEEIQTEIDFWNARLVYLNDILINTPQEITYAQEELDKWQQKMTSLVTP